MKTIESKISIIKVVIMDYNKTEEEMDIYNANMFEDGELKRGMHEKWCELYDYNKRREKTLKRYVRSLAKDLGFVIKKREYDSLASEWIRTFEEIEHQYAEAMRVLHDIPFYVNRIANETDK